MFSTRACKIVYPQNLPAGGLRDFIFEEQRLDILEIH
jgi:hypothetical protein